MHHDKCYDSGVDQVECDGAMTEELLTTDYPDSYYGKAHMYAAEAIMSVKGKGSKSAQKRQGIDELLYKEGKTLTTEAKNLEELIKHQILEKGGNGKSKRQKRKENALLRAAALEAHRSVHKGKGPKPKSKGFKKTKQQHLAPQDRKREQNMKSWKIGMYKGKRGERGLTLRGSDMIDRIQITSAATTAPNQTALANNPGTILNNNGTTTGMDINPLKFANSRIKQFGQLFQKFRFRKISFRFVSALSEFYGGTFGHYIDYDAQADYTTINGLETALEVCSAHQGYREIKAKDNGTAVFRPKDPEAAFWIKNSGDVRTFEQASYFFFLIDSINTSSGAPSVPLLCGRIYMDYEIEFWEDAIGEGTLTGPPGIDDGFPLYSTWGDSILRTATGQTAGTSLAWDMFAQVIASYRGSWSLAEGTSNEPNEGYADDIGTFIHIDALPGTNRSYVNIYGCVVGRTYRLTAFMIMNAGSPVAGTLPTFSYVGCTQTVNLHQSVAVGNSLQWSYNAQLVCTQPDMTIACTSGSGWSAASITTSLGWISFKDATLVADSPVARKGVCRYDAHARGPNVDFERLFDKWVPSRGCKNSLCSFCPRMQIVTAMEASRKKLKARKPSAETLTLFQSKQDKVLIDYDDAITRANKEWDDAAPDSDDDSDTEKEIERHLEKVEEDIAARNFKCEKRLSKFLTAHDDARRAQCLRKLCHDEHCQWCPKTRALAQAHVISREKIKQTQK